MANIVCDGIDVSVKRRTANNGEPGGTFVVAGKADGKVVSGTITFYDGGEFDTQLDRDLVIRIFTALDEQGWDV